MIKFIARKFYQITHRREINGVRDYLSNAPARAWLWKEAGLEERTANTVVSASAHFAMDIIEILGVTK